MRRKFTKDSDLDWRCPNCKKVSLEIIKDSLIEEETQSSIEYRRMYNDNDPENKEFNASGQFNCKNCNEKVFFIGQSTYFYHQYFDEMTGTSGIDEGMEYTPKFIYPGICLFDIPKECPKEIEIEIKNSFNLFWCDSEACVNKIRQSLEILMNEFKVKKTYLNKKNERHEYSLDKRIEKFPIEDIRTHLLALKLVGNSGSHHGTKLQEIDIENTYKVLKYILDKLYSNEEEEINRLTKEIIKRKGAGKKKK